MKERIVTGWNLQRILFTIIGCMVMIQSISDKQWWGILFGAYFASMGLFAIGCAAGSCYTGKPYYKPDQKDTTNLENVDFEEIKTK